MDQFGKKLDICRKNALECSERMERDFESRESHIADLFSVIGEKLDGNDPDAIREEYAALMKSGVRADAICVPLGLSDGTAFASQFILPEIRDAYSVRRGGGDVAYCKNALTDDSFARFSRSLREIRPKRASSFEESCEIVYSARADFCILPVENSRDGLLSGFRRMIDRYELYVCGLCRIEENEDDTVKAALLCRDPVFFPPKNDDRTKRLCTVSVTLQEYCTLSRLLSASEMFGMTLARAHSVPDEDYYSDPGRSYLLTFEIKNEPKPFLNWLELEGHGWKLMGAYNYFTK